MKTLHSSTAWLWSSNTNCNFTCAIANTNFLFHSLFPKRTVFFLGAFLAFRHSSWFIFFPHKPLSLHTRNVFFLLLFCRFSYCFGAKKGIQTFRTIQSVSFYFGMGSTQSNKWQAIMEQNAKNSQSSLNKRITNKLSLMTGGTKWKYFFEIND